MNIIKNTIAVIAVSSIALLAAGCTSAASTPDPKASAASSVTEETPEATVEENPFIQPFGGVVTYDDGVSVSVGAPVDFQITEYGLGGDQAHNVAFEVVITNNSDEPVTPSPFPSVSSGGVEASMIADTGNTTPGYSAFGPTTDILPGQTVKWLTAYSIADPAVITFQVAPSFSYDEATFTNIDG